MAYVGTPIDTTNQFQSLVGKRFDGDGSTTAFTLDVAPSSTLDIEVFVENVRQDPNSAYSLSGTTLTFAAAPPSGTNNIYVVHQAKAVGTISPAAGTVNADSFDNTVISGHTALATKPDATDEFLVSDAGTIKRIDYSLLSPISMVDQWRLTTGFTGDANPISSNLERVDSPAFGQVGTGMSVSSGYWTFPSTGVYLVMASGFFRFGTVGGEEADGNFQIYATTDNSSYVLLTGSKFSFAYDYAIRENHRTISAIVDVTNTTNVKVYFTTNAVTSGTTTSGHTDRNETHFTFIRLGDT